MSSDSRITACFVLHQSGEDLAPLLHTLERQTRLPDHLVACVNGPDGGVLERLRALGGRVTVLHRPENPGFSTAVNACLDHVKTSHVLLINPDVELDPDYLARCLEVFDEEENVAGVSGLLLRPSGCEGIETLDTAGFVTQPWMRIVDRGSGAQGSDIFTERESVVGVCAAATVFRMDSLREVAEDGRILDEDFWMYKEDQDLCIRLREIGQRLILEPAIRGRHRRGWAPETQRKEIGLKLRQHSLKNRYLILLKHWRFREHVWTLPFLVGFEAFLFAALALREPKTMKGYFLALKLVPRMLEKRRALMKRVQGLGREYLSRSPTIPLVP